MRWTEEADAGGWSGWQEIEVEPPDLPSEDPGDSSLTDSDEDAAELEGEISIQLISAFYNG